MELWTCNLESAALVCHVAERAEITPDSCLVAKVNGRMNAVLAVKLLTSRAAAMVTTSTEKRLWIGRCIIVIRSIDAADFGFL